MDSLLERNEKKRKQLQVEYEPVKLQAATLLKEVQSKLRQLDDLDKQRKPILARMDENFAEWKDLHAVQKSLLDTPHSVEEWVGIW